MVGEGDLEPGAGRSAKCLSPASRSCLAMKVVILAGGRGTRLGEETEVRPKPMVEVGNKPILWHIMKIYSHHGFDEFVICLGYKGYMIKEYFSNYFLHSSDVTIDVKADDVEVHRESAEPWRVTLVDTGLDTMTGGRLKRVASYLGDETFCFTYGDGVADIDLRAVLDQHREQGTWATLTGVRLPGRFGALEIEDDRITSFSEKPEGHGWINGGFMVLEPEVLDLIEGDETVWEREPMESLARKGELSVYQHPGFWHPMDTAWDLEHLQTLWREDPAPWKVWG